MSEHPAVLDAREARNLGLERGGHLLTAGELATIRRAAELGPDAALLHVRLLDRVSDVVRTEGLDAAALDELSRAELVDRLVSSHRRLEATTVQELVSRCRAAGLSAGGRKSELVERLSQLGFPRGVAVVRVRHRELFRRLWRWADLSAFPDPRVRVVERLGHVSWPAYERTEGPSLHRDRRSLLSWEAALSAVDPSAALAALEAGHGRAPGGLDLRRTLRRRVRDAAEAIEREDPATAAEWYTRAVLAGEARDRVAFRWARALEACGRPREALAVLREALHGARPAEAAAIVRAGRRLAKQLRTGFPPLPPAVPLTERELRLPRSAPIGGRPGWEADGLRTVEDAVVTTLAGAGRRAVHAEGAPWRTLGVLLLAELLFLPVPGALPVARLPGPLDLGDRAFREARREAFDALADRLSAGHGGALVREAWARFAGTRLVGAHWELGEELIVGLAEALPPAAHLLVATAVADGVKTSGLPDLVVLPGPEIELPGAWPRRVPRSLVAAEVKGPTDQLRDGQVAWLDRLARAGVRTEVWRVSATWTSGVVTADATE